MIRTALKTVFAHKLRLALTALSVMMGVAFIAGTFIFTDTIDDTFGQLFDDIYEGQDIIVQATTEFDVGFSGPPPIDVGVLDTVLAVPGVEVAEGGVSSLAVIYDKDGEGIVPTGPPTLGGSITEDLRLAGNAQIREGRVPEAADEVAIDAATAESNELAIGDVVRIQTSIEVGDYEIVGIIGFGESDNLAGATFAGFELETAQRIMDLEGVFSGITVIVEEGANVDVVRNSIAVALPEGVEAVSAADEAAQQSEALSESLGFLQNALLIFALVAVFVATFIIQNTFRIIVRQRQKELALMRAVGATGSQVVWMVVIEAVVVGVFASILGLAFGFVIAQLLTAGMAAVGFDLPSTAATLAPRTIIVGLTVGIVVTIASAVLPAIRASRIPPVAALQDVDITLRMSDRRRTIIGVALLVFGMGGILNGLFGDVLDFGPLDELTAIGVGAIFVFLAVSMLSSLVVKPAARFLGWPMVKLDNMTGSLAVENSVRKPRRTATTASALMIGLALVTFFFVLGDSIKASAGAAIEEGLRADYVVSVDGFSGGFSTALGEELREEPEIGAVTPLRFSFWDNEGSEDFVMGIDTDTVDETILLGVVHGSTEALGEGGVFVLEDIFNDNDLVLGDTIPMGFVATGLQQVEVVGVFTEANVVQANYLVGLDFHEANFAGYGADLDFVLAVNAADGADAAAARNVVEAAAADYGNVTVRDQVEYRDSQEDQVDQILVLFNALLFLAVIIAVIGIVNTLALSIFERTREIGLLRAVGTSRWQIRRMITWEAIIVAVIGAVLGIVVGLFFGVSVTAALASQGIDVLSIPLGQIIGLVIFGAFAGLLAAILPARRAAKLNILEAISYQ
ncbi:MAG: FtsX-like permease family protein [Acidimicrobiia bacterium]|nr:FtsX-like permease family protein [Acidimicrobiia bacterium]MDX2466648.1 FtsX-like permease family protein [Acidimicrobiia bacterium]